MPPSSVPAFIATAPPMVAGMPTRHSSPPRFSAAASRMRADRLTPAPATASSPWNSARPRQPSSFSTTPRMPRSRTRRLLPPPTTSTGRPSLSAKASARRMSSTSCGTMKKSAGPPMRKDVWKLRGSLKRTSPRISPSMRYLLSRPSPGAPRPASTSAPSAPTSPAPRVLIVSESKWSSLHEAQSTSAGCPRPHATPESVRISLRCSRAGSLPKQSCPTRTGP